MKRLICILLLLAVLFATSCGNQEVEQSKVAILDSPTSAGSGELAIDASTLNDGYFGVAFLADTRLKVMVEKDDFVRAYDMSNDGTSAVYPITKGSGTYQISVWQNTTGDNYINVASGTFEATITDDLLPYLRPSYLCDYSIEDDLILQASILAEGKDTESSIRAITGWISKEITYDHALAESAPKGYIANPQTTYITRKGICIDYATLTAAMLRSQGVPTKIITGYVYPSGILHAWNEVWTGREWIEIDTIGLLESEAHTKHYEN